MNLVRMQYDGSNKWQVGTATGSMIGSNKLIIGGGWWIVFTGSKPDAIIIRDAYMKIGYHEYKNGKIVAVAV
jgi:hypothetical protein